MDRCGSLWDRCGSLWDRCGIVVGRGSLWVVPGFSNYGGFVNFSFIMIRYYCFDVTHAAVP